jgi:Predicted metal-dependent protease of the PAD1/JAB1 superfamily
MANKKSKKRNIKSDIFEQYSNVLPQNIVSIGERVEEDKKIYISQKVYKEIHRFTQDKTTNENGGMLIGTVIEEFGKQNIIINGFIEAKYSEGTPTTLKFTHETWEYVHKEITKKYANQKIVGWIHTHPDFGIFLSEYDKFIQENFFKDENQIAYVVDPIQNIEGFYFWINEKIERCKGFYVFDKTGVKITVTNDSDEGADNINNKSKLGYLNILLGIVSAAIVVLLIMNFSLNNRLNKIEQQQMTLTDSANNSLSYMQQQIASLSQELKALKELKSNPEDKQTNATSDEESTPDHTDKNEQSKSDKNQSTDVSQ